MLGSPYALYLVAHDEGLFPVAVCLFQYKAFTLVVTAEHVFWYLPLIMAYQAVGRLHYALRAAVVLLELEQLCPCKLFLEIKYIVDVGTTEGIDTLGIVANGTNTQMLF